MRFLSPEPPPIQDIAIYYGMAEQERFYSNGGPCSRLLSERLGAYLGDGASVLPVANCTVGLMVALRATCGTPRGSRRLIATPSFTFPATACAIIWAGFEPLFVDIDPDSWQLDAAALEAALAAHPGQVAGVLACSTFGAAPPQATRAGWRASCARRSIPLVIDSASGLGSVDEAGDRIGGLGETEIFSFHATKPFSVGEGGIIVTADPEVAHRATRLANFGMPPGGRESEEVGINAKMSELVAATALAMLDRYDAVLAARRANADRLLRACADLPIRTQAGARGSTWQVFQVTLPSRADRNAALIAAEAGGVQARHYFDPPLHRQEAFAEFRSDGPLPVTEALSGRMLSLPMANDLSDRQVARIAGTLRAALAVSLAA